MSTCCIILLSFLVAVHGTDRKELPSTKPVPVSTVAPTAKAAKLSSVDGSTTIAEPIGFLVAIAPMATIPPEKASTRQQPISSTRGEATKKSGLNLATLLPTFQPPAPLKSQPRILEITTHVTDPRPGPLEAHIDGIDTHLEPAQHSIPTAVEEKLEALSCEVPPLPTNSELWNGNQTRDLKLPVLVTAECEADEADCPYKLSLSWDAAADVQTGDVLLIRIDDHTLIHQPPTTSSSGLHHEPTAAVYQVNRSGYDHCDISDGTLLDITPLIVDGQKLIPLYDKDLTEGINLLIVVSEQWGKECIRLSVSVKSDNCGENADCSNKGVCFSNASMEEFECECCPGFIGPHCEEKDACYPSPCHNNGICVDLSQGHEGSTYQCLCPYGYSGKQCQDEADPCERTPCRHGGRCHWNQTNYYCECMPGYVGEHCERSLDVCGGHPCKNGLCIRQGEGYACFCRPGYAGDNCEFEYNECQSSPCENGATCADTVNGYQCICGRGFTGKRCQVKVDLCDPNPCAEGRFCVDRGNNYSCQCPRGYVGLHCTQPVKAVCSDNHCQNGGTCWGSVSSFYCACSKGFTGEKCERKILESEYPDSVSLEDLALARKLEKLHNIYIAVGTLSCALLFVIIIVAVCHCRVHELYKKCFVHSTPLLPCKIRRLDLLPKQTWRGKAHFEQEREALTSQSRPLPTIDPTEVYYTLDFSGDQHSPLIE